jgi:hypothetical protein
MNDSATVWMTTLEGETVLLPLIEGSPARDSLKSHVVPVGDLSKVV